MFQKILIAEDLDSIGIAVSQALAELSIAQVQHSKYCDDAFLKIKKALQDGEPYDLLITDLSFKIDHRDTKLTCGDELIDAVKKIQPDIKIIVFSIEDKTYKIKSLFNDLGINAYVSKGRNSIPQLQKAIQRIYLDDEKFLSAEWSHVLSDKSLLEIEAYDITLLKLLSKGFTLNEISLELKTSGIIPHGSSSIEKRINRLKIYFKANNNVHLIAIAKDLGLV
jgi:DNA-binding NarL/FixJ family response regulator